MSAAAPANTGQEQKSEQLAKKADKQAAKAAPKQADKPADKQAEKKPVEKKAPTKTSPASDVQPKPDAPAASASSSGAPVPKEPEKPAPAEAKDEPELVTLRGVFNGVKDPDDLCVVAMHQEQGTAIPFEAVRVTRRAECSQLISRPSVSRVWVVTPRRRLMVLP